MAAWPFGFVTTTFTAPAACAGVDPVIVVELATTTFVTAEPPRETVAPATNPLPEMLTDVPPAVVPELGVIPVIVGGATGAW